MTTPTNAGAQRSGGERGASDPAVEFLSSLQPNEPMLRRRVFAALLRAVVSEGQGR